MSKQQLHKQPHKHHTHLEFVLQQAFLRDLADGSVQCAGNRTECALLLLLRHWGCSYTAVRDSHTVVKVFGFSSERKMASAVVLLDGKHILYCKVGR